MELSNNDRSKILMATELLKSKNKIKINEDKNKTFILKWQDGDTIDDKIDDIDKTDTKLLKHLAERVLDLIEDYPELKQELKYKYF
jgi:hypothetical protein